MKQTIVIFDFETTHIDAESDLCDPIEIGAVALHSKYLNTIKGSEFFAVIRPDTIDDPDYYEKHKKTIDWHLSLPHNKDHTPQSIIDKWKMGTPEKQVWQQFHDYVNQYNFYNSYKTAPIAGGQNIKNFDLKIYDRLNKKHKTKPCFSKRDALDTLEMCFYWFAFHPDPPKSYAMDDLRPYFGLSSHMGHNALMDVQQEAEIAKMFLNCQKKFSGQVKFRNSLSNGQL